MTACPCWPAMILPQHMHCIPRVLAEVSARRLSVGHWHSVCIHLVQPCVFAALLACWGL